MQISDEYVHLVVSVAQTVAYLGWDVSLRDVLAEQMKSTASKFPGLPEDFVARIESRTRDAQIEVSTCIAIAMLEDPAFRKAALDGDFSNATEDTLTAVFKNENFHKAITAQLVRVGHTFIREVAMEYIHQSADRLAAWEASLKPAIEE